MLTVAHIFRNKQKQSLNHEYFVNSKRNKSFFVQFPKYIIWPPFLVDVSQNEIICAVLQPQGKLTIHDQLDKFHLNLPTKLTLFFKTQKKHKMTKWRFQRLVYDKPKLSETQVLNPCVNSTSYL